MIKLAYLFNCMLLCSILTLLSCTKDNHGADIAPFQNSANRNLANTALIHYMPGDSLVIKGDTANGDETVLLHSGYGGVSTPNFVSFTALGDRFGGIEGHDRSIMKFRIRNVSDSLRNNPPQIKKAILYLYQYHRPADRDPYSVTQTDDNSVELHRIVEDWDEHTITWTTQPKLAKGSANPLEDVVIIPSVNIPLPAGTNDDQVVDVTDMVRRIIATGNDKGFLLKLNPKGEGNTLCGRAYGSFTCPVMSKRPKLVLYF